MARWVLPVLVGPSTAVTPWPRAPASRVDEEKEMGIQGSRHRGRDPTAPRTAMCVSQCDAGGARPGRDLKVANESGPMRGRITDSGQAVFLSLGDRVGWGGLAHKMKKATRRWDRRADGQNLNGRDFLMDLHAGGTWRLRRGDEL